MDILIKHTVLIPSMQHVNFWSDISRTPIVDNLFFFGINCCQALLVKYFNLGLDGILPWMYTRWLAFAWIITARNEVTAR